MGRNLSKVTKRVGGSDWNLGFLSAVLTCVCVCFVL